MAADEELDESAGTEPTEVIALRVPLNLVPRWSNIVERMCRDFGDEVEVGAETDALVIKVRLKVADKGQFYYTVQQNWKRYADNERIIGNWSRD